MNYYVLKIRYKKKNNAINEIDCPAPGNVSRAEREAWKINALEDVECGREWLRHWCLAEQIEASHLVFRFYIVRMKVRSERWRHAPRFTRVNVIYFVCCFNKIAVLVQRMKTFRLNMYKIGLLDFLRQVQE